MRRKGSEQNRRFGVCIVEGPWLDTIGLRLPASGGPAKGDIVTVKCVHPSPFSDTTDLFLGFREYDPVLHYQSCFFRKIPPSSEEHIRKLQEPFNIKEKVNG